MQRADSKFLFIAVLSGIVLLQSNFARAATLPHVAVEELPGARIHLVALAENGQDIKLKVVTACTDGAAIFKVFNEGQAWPAQGTFGIYKLDTDGKVMISHRSMRLVAGQQASFRVAKAGDSRLALFVAPGWYKRDFIHDAEVVCK